MPAVIAPWGAPLGTGITTTLTLQSPALITTSGSDLTIQPDTGYITKVGSAFVSNHGLNTEEDLGVENRLEVNGTAWFDDTVRCGSGFIVTYGNAQFLGHLYVEDDKGSYVGSSLDAGMLYSRDQTPDSMMLMVGGDSRTIVMCEKGDVTTDFGAPLATNPTFRGQSANAADPTEYWSITHNQTNPVADSGKGVWQFVDGIRTKVDTSDVTTPTDAELDAAFGTPATVGSGFMALVDDNGAGTSVYLVASDGTNWWYHAMTKAV